LKEEIQNLTRLELFQRFFLILFI